MHKKLEAELVSLAHSILQMKNKEDVNALHKKALDIYEKLSVLKFVDNYLNTTIDETITKEEIEGKFKHVLVENVEENANEVASAFEETVDEVVENELQIENLVEEKEILLEAQVEEIVETENEVVKNIEEDVPSLQFTLEDEFKDAISADVATKMFEKVTKENPEIEENPATKQRSLNDTLITKNLQVGLNDRIAFVKHLFDGSQEDFNRVLSQLNSFKTETETKNFINKFVKPDYNWENKEEYEERLINLIERKFM